MLHLENLYEQHKNAPTANEAHKNRVKNQYDKSFQPRVFSEGELVLLWDQDKEPMGAGKFKFMWLRPYVMLKFLKNGNKLSEPRNGLYLKKYYD